MATKRSTATTDTKPVDTTVLESVQRRVLWLATRIVDSANRERETRDGVKVGGHQASSASLVTIMTALWFAHLRHGDRVSVKPHASPTFHAIQYLLGELDQKYLTQLRAYGGLQSYPSRTKDPDRVDFSTGSVGLGAVAPLFAAATRRYVDAKFGPRDPSRFIALIGDAELDEGNIWEAVADPATHGLGNVTWIIDVNRQSLDRIVPGVRVAQWQQQFAAHGWDVRETKYGRKLRAAFAAPGGDALRDWIDGLSNEHYQALFTRSGDDLRELFLENAPKAVVDLCKTYDDDALYTLVTDLGGHDIADVLDVLQQADTVTDRPTVIFAYTVKGFGLPNAGDVRNHSALLNAEQIDTLRASVGLTPATEWDRFDPASAEGVLAGQRSQLLHAAPPADSPAITVPPSTNITASRPVSTQDTFGRILTNLSRDDNLLPYLVTTSPDVATSTNLAGFINRVGVFSPEARRTYSTDPLLRWEESPEGQHIELGISEMNLYGLLGQLGLSWDLSNQPLIPIGTLYDPFVARGLDALIYAVYSGSRFIFAGTPSGVTLAAEGGAHQSSITASIGIELPNITYIEPAYAVALDWLLCDAARHVADRQAASDTPGVNHEGAYYFRLTTRPLDQEPFTAARERLGDAILRRHVLAGAYRLHDATVNRDEPTTEVQIAACGAVVPEALEASRRLADEGIAAHVIDITSPDRLYRSWQQTMRQGVRSATVPAIPGAIRSAFVPRVPVVTVQDAASHALAWIGSALGVATVPLGVDSFGQSGNVYDLYQANDLSSDAIVNAALAALSV